jgi:hypothetical protein
MKNGGSNMSAWPTGYQIALLLVCGTQETKWYEISFVALVILYLFECSYVSLKMTLQSRNM